MRFTMLASLALSAVLFATPQTVATAQQAAYSKIISSKVVPASATVAKTSPVKTSPVKTTSAAKPAKVVSGATVISSSPVTVVSPATTSAVTTKTVTSPTVASPTVGQVCPQCGQVHAQPAAVANSFQAEAEAEARQMASRRYKGHVRGTIAGVRFCGVGWSSSSPNAPTCRPSGNMTLVADAVVRGSDGWYRVRYWQ